MHTDKASIGKLAQLGSFSWRKKEYLNYSEASRVLERHLRGKQHGPHTHLLQAAPLHAAGEEGEVHRARALGKHWRADGALHGCQYGERGGDHLLLRHQGDESGLQTHRISNFMFSPL